VCHADPRRSLRLERMGRVAYGPMLALQERRHAEVIAGTRDDTLFLLEHEPVITLGKNAGADHVLASPAALQASGVELFETGRGGDVTFHGPGQLVGYPVIQLQEGERDVQRYVTCLEEVMIRTAHDFGVVAQRVDGLRGIWVGNDKLGAVGVRIANWTTLHGFALNVARDVPGFELIVPCGIRGRGVTSLSRACDRDLGLDEVMARVAEHAAIVLDRRGIDQKPTPLSSYEPERRGVRSEEVAL
jgi:lipoyl(octanoyl) transferase